MVPGICILKPDPVARKYVFIGKVGANEQGDAEDDSQCESVVEVACRWLHSNVLYIHPPPLATVLICTFVLRILIYRMSFEISGSVASRF